MLVVGGGGGGGWHAGAGGGAGGLVFSGAHAVVPGGSYAVTVGAGGLGSVNRGNPNCDPPTSGGNSSFDTLAAAGGGFGGYSTWAAHFPAAAGGSGGGGFMSSQFGTDKLVGGAGTSGQGNAGANGSENVYSGGGGGAGAAANTRNGGNGLDYSSLFGTDHGASGWFAGGGGGGARTTGTAGTGGTGGGGAGATSTGSAANGLANTGGGGGGGGEGNGICGNGGSGVVLLSIAGFTPPVVATLNPTNNAAGVPDTANLVVTFDQAVQAGLGNIEIRKSGDDSLIESIAVTSGLVTISGGTATINPSGILPADTGCYVRIPAGAFTASVGSLLPFAGMTDTTTWSFTTAGPPLIATLNPANNAAGVPDTANLVVTFDQAVQAGTGNIEIRKSGDSSLIELIDVTSGLVTISGASATINPSGMLPASTECYVRIPAGAFTATIGSLLPFAGMTDTTTWSFTTAGPPLIATLNPANNAAGVPDTANLVVTFDQAVQAGTGNIEIRKSGDSSLIELIDVTSGLVTISGASATINPSGMLPASTECYVRIPAGAFTATIGSLLPFAGITDTTTWSFTTAGPPIIATLNPADNASGVSIVANLVVTFDQAVQKGTGNIEIRKSGDNSVIESIDVTSGLVTISGAAATINPSGVLPVSTECYVRIPAGAFTAAIGSLLPFAGITDNTTWSFTTGGPILADARGDFRTATVGGTTADFNGGTGLSDTQGSGRWNYLDGATPTLLTFGAAGNAGQSMYMTTGQTNGLPALGDQQIFGNVPAPAAGKIQWHAGATTAQSAVMRWTAGANVINLAIAGTIARGIVVGANNTKFDILVDGVNQFTILLNDTAPHSFNVTGLSISAGQHVQFILSTPNNNNGGAIADLQATITGELSAAGGYASWAATNAPAGAPGDDYDGDGVSNGVEYVLGGTKDTNDLAKLPKLSTTPGGDLLFTFERDQASIDGTTTAAIEAGTDLTAWTPYAVPNGATGPVNPGVTVVKDSPVAGKDTVTLTIPRAPDAKKFARLRVTAP